MHARNFTTNVPKILDLKSSSEQIFSRKLSLGAPESYPSTLSSPVSIYTRQSGLGRGLLICVHVKNAFDCSVILCVVIRESNF